jgi:hypothetical protein
MAAIPTAKTERKRRMTKGTEGYRGVDRWKNLSSGQLWPGCDTPFLDRSEGGVIFAKKEC